MENSKDQILQDFEIYRNFVSSINEFFCIKPNYGFKNAETKVILNLIYDAIKASFPYHFNNQIKINIKNNEKTEYYKIIYDFLHSLADIIQLLNDVITEKRKRIFYHADYNAYNDIISVMEILAAYYPGNFSVKYETLTSFILIKQHNLKQIKADVLKEVISNIHAQLFNVYIDYRYLLLEYQKEVIIKYIEKYNNSIISEAV